MIALSCAFLFCLVILMDNRLPEPLRVADISTQPDRFIEERARRSLRALTSVGARPAGSYENEVLAVDLIVQELTSIKNRAKPIHRVSVDIQVHTARINESKRSVNADHAADVTG